MMIAPTPEQPEPTAGSFKTDQSDRSSTGSGCRSGPLPREEWQRLQNIVAGAPVGIFSTTPNGRLLTANTALARMYGYATPRELMDGITDIGKQMYAVLQDREEFRRLLQTQGEVFDYECRQLHRTGSVFWTSISAMAVTDANGKIIHYQGFITDITTRKQTELILRAGEERACRQRSALAKLALDTVINSGDTHAAFTRLVTITAATINVARTSIWLLSEDATQLQCVTLYEAATGRFSHGQVLNTVDFPHYFKAVYDESRIYANDAPTDSRTRELADIYLIPHGITALLDAGIITKGRLAGVISLEHVGTRRQWHPDEEAFASTMAAMAAQILANAERQQALEDLIKSEERYRNLFEKAPVGIFQTTLAGRYLSVNPAYAQLAGYATPEEMIARVDDIAHYVYVVPDVRRQYLEMLHQQGTVNNFEAEYKRRDGGTYWVSMNTSVEYGPQGQITYNGFLTDITQRKQAEEAQAKLYAQLLQAQKMEAVGTLAGGVAHDFNNLLQAIGGYTQIMLLSKDSDHPDHARLKIIERTVERAAQLVRRLLLFSRKVEAQRRPTHLNLEIQDVALVLEHTLPRMIEIELQLGHRLWSINADPIQIEQLLLNLGNNAADAMPNGGKLLISTKNITLDHHFVRSHLDTRAGNHVLLQVSDTGCGMDKQTVTHIFDPFFTTKEVGRGTGLGLASVYGIVKTHDGTITCTSARGQGTTFNIYLPALAERATTPDSHTERSRT